MIEQETTVADSTLREVTDASGDAMVAIERAIRVAHAHKSNPGEMRNLVALGHIAHSVAYEMWRLSFNLGNPTRKVEGNESSG